MNIRCSFLTVLAALLTSSPLVSTISLNRRDISAHIPMIATLITLDDLVSSKESIPESTMDTPFTKWHGLTTVNTNKVTRSIPANVEKRPGLVRTDKALPDKRTSDLKNIKNTVFDKMSVGLRGANDEDFLDTGPDLPHTKEDRFDMTDKVNEVRSLANVKGEILGWDTSMPGTKPDSDTVKNNLEILGWDKFMHSTKEDSDTVKKDNSEMVEWDTFMYY
jgi:hypothetical protein